MRSREIAVEPVTAGFTAPAAGVNCTSDELVGVPDFGSQLAAVVQRPVPDPFQVKFCARAGTAAMARGIAIQAAARKNR